MSAQFVKIKMSSNVSSDFLLVQSIHCMFVMIYVNINRSHILHKSKIITVFLGVILIYTVQYQRKHKRKQTINKSTSKETSIKALPRSGNFLTLYNCQPLLPPATKLRQGNVFTPVCHSVHRQGVCHIPLGRPRFLGRQPPGRHPPCAVHAGIQSTSGRYASYWNAILFYANSLFLIGDN